mgnify:CR=1 FL=1
MNNLNLSNPKMMDVAVPANKNLGFKIEHQKKLNGIKISDLKTIGNENDLLLIDLRESHEIENRASLPNSTHIPYSRLQEFVTSKKEEIKNKNEKVIFISGHFANFELMSMEILSLIHI